MPQKVGERDKRRESLFSDLGRPTRRGVRLCPKCQTLNGTRGNVCKNKSCDVVFRDNNGAKRKPTTDACRVSTINLQGSELQIFSVRIRDRGPDYRNFVHLPFAHLPISTVLSVGSVEVPPVESGTPENNLLIPDPGSLPKCYIDICSKNKVFPCSHIKSAQNCFSTAEPILINESTLVNLNIPYESKEVILEMVVEELPGQLIQRVSKTSFIVKCPVSVRHPLGFLHILFFKPNLKEDRNPNAEPKFLCTCRPYKMTKNESDALSNETPLPIYESSTKLCIHYYACICAFASHEELELEFEYFVSHATSQEYPQRPPIPGTLAQIDLNSIRHNNPDVIDVEEMDQNQMSAEIIRENISLLESIAGTDDSSLPNSLESGLPEDQIIATGVEDSLNFGDSSALDGLDDPDAQVSGHLTHISEILSQTNPNQQVIFTNSNNLHMSNSFGSHDSDVHDLTDQSDFLNLPSNSHRSQDTSHMSFKPPPPKKLYLNKNGNRLKRGMSSLNHDPSGFTSSNLQIQNDGSASGVSVIENRISHPGFEQWLAGINERINASMNYEFDGNPEPFVLFAPQEYFDILKDRIISGWRKKRLPNQTVIIHQRDRPPLGTFAKHIWKITNIVHVLRIFSCSIVPLKIIQFFIQTANGDYDEWSSAREEVTKNTPIIPVLHGTSLRIGNKPDLTARDMVPFTIEWMENVLPQSKYGELSLSFQFNHSGPIHTDEERRNSVAPLQKLLQNHNLEFSKQDLQRIGVLF